MMNLSQPSTKALFLDRDGVININYGYVYRQENIDFVDGIFDLALNARNAGYIIVIVTNQSGIARDYYTQQEFKALSRWLENQFWTRGIKIQQTLHCPHHPKFSHRCCCRKPKIGMITKAARRFNINLSKSIMVGDSQSDVKCAQHAKIGTRVFINPKLPRSRGTLRQPISKPYFETTTLSNIKRLLI